MAGLLAWGLFPLFNKVTDRYYRNNPIIICRIMK